MIKLLARIAYPPDRVRAVVAHQQRSIGRDRDTHGTSPNLAVGRYEPGQKVFVLSRGMTGLMQRHADHFIPGARRLVPRSVRGRKKVSLVLGWKFVRFIERDLQR